MLYSRVRLQSHGGGGGKRNLSRSRMNRGIFMKRVVTGVKSSALTFRA